MIKENWNIIFFNHHEELVFEFSSACILLKKRNSILLSLFSAEKSYLLLLLVSAEAQICAREAVEGARSDEEGQDANFKRASNGDGGRKRRVVLDFSDEDEFEDAVNLASPESPKEKSCIVSKQNTKPLVSDKINLNFDQEEQDKPKVKEEKLSNRESNQSTRENSSVLSKDKNNDISSSDKIPGGIPEIEVNKKDKVPDPASPKRRKVMKTRIDERGREGKILLRKISLYSPQACSYSWLFF